MNNEQNTVQESPRTESPAASIERRELAAIAGALPLRSKVRAGGKTIGCRHECSHCSRG